MAVAPNLATASQGLGKKESSAGEKVVVANKLPMPLRLRTFSMVSSPNVSKNGEVEIKHRATGAR